MYSCDDQGWPFVIFDFNGLQSLQEHEQSLKDWNSYFLCKTSFIALRIFRDEASLIHPEGSAQMTKVWLRNGAAQSIKNSVLAMINIVPESAYERMRHMNVETVFGVPGGVFKSTVDAAEWFNANLGVREKLYLDSDKLC